MWQLAAGLQMLVNPRSKFRTLIPSDDFEGEEEQKNGE